jgi:hypothetical protein
LPPPAAAVLAWEWVTELELACACGLEWETLGEVAPVGWSAD